jgi:hypothetical protein
MKIKSSNQDHTSGSTLVVTLSVVAVAAIVLASYLFMVQNETAAVARSQTWNGIIPVSEAGVEEGLALVNTGGPIIVNPWAWTNAAAGYGWSLTNGAYIKTNTVSGANYYVVTVTVVSNIPTITSLGVTPLSSVPWSYSSAPQPFLAAAGVTLGGTAGNLYREVQVQTIDTPLFSYAIVTKSNFNMNGNNTLIDSFDSSNPLYSTAGQYNAAKRKANGSIATDASVTGDISLGNGNIYGTVFTGPGTAQSAVQVGANGAVGTAAWNASSTGVEPGYWSGDFNMNIPDVSPPATGGLTALPAPVGGVVILSGGSYTISPSDPNIGAPIVVTGPTTMWVQGGYSPSGLTIASTNNADLALYVGTTGGSGDSLSLAGTGTVNSPGYAANLQFYGLPSLNSFTLSGNAAFIGTIYAPDADFTGNGGGSAGDSAGGMVVRSVTLHGHWGFHYDESLQNNGPSRGWIAHAWTEVKAPNQ